MNWRRKIERFDRTKVIQKYFQIHHFKGDQKNDRRLSPQIDLGKYNFLVINK